MWGLLPEERFGCSIIALSSWLHCGFEVDDKVCDDARCACASEARASLSA